ncbi:MAG: 50S ribosomal protein L18 [Candidatus Omnitrophota bacterium]
MSKKREALRLKRHSRARLKIMGTQERPRLCVHLSHKNCYAQIIDDMKAKTLVSASSMEKDFLNTRPKGKTKVAEHLGGYLAAKAKKHGLSKVVFDKSGYLYHGRVKSFAEAARKSGLEF